MPAKKKYLSSNFDRFLKITSGIIGGSSLATLLHFVFGIFINDKPALFTTMFYTFFLLWVFFFLLSFMFKKAWKSWLFYLVSSGFCLAIIFIFKK